MKKFLIALAMTVALVGPAHAEIAAREPDQIFDCSNIGYGNVVNATSEHISDGQVYNIEIAISRRGKTTRTWPPVVVFDMSGKNIKLKVNGKSCKAIQEGREK
jgi:hypothetical protein